MYNIQDCWDYLHIWVSLKEDMKKWEWVNIKVPKRHIKDKSLDDDILLNDV